MVTIHSYAQVYRRVDFGTRLMFDKIRSKSLRNLPKSPNLAASISIPSRFTGGSPVAPGGPQMLIASIRRQRLGDAASRSVGCGVRRALGAAVERLAVDLYDAWVKWWMTDAKNRHW